MRLPQPTHLNYSSLVADIMKGLIKIPQFQRDFVWTVERSAKLLDSIVKGYPIGTFIFWATRERLRSVRNIGGISLPDAKDRDIVMYVLDGQQRLTSLFAALRGLTVLRLSGAEDNFGGIYLDLAAGENDQIVISDLTGRDAASCIKLNDLLHGTLTKLASYPEHLHKKIDEYKRHIEGYDFPVVEVRDVELPVATEIFTRINVGGQPLTLFEIMVAKTYDEAREFDLAQQYDQLIERLNSIDYGSISDTIVLQLVSMICKRDCKRQTILEIDRNEFIDRWPKVVDALERAAEYFRDTYRIPVSGLLPYGALLVPFGYFFYMHPDKPDGVRKQRLEDLFWRCSIGGRYSASVESKLVQDIQRVDTILAGQQAEYDWPIDISPQFVRDNGWFGTSRAFIKPSCAFTHFSSRSPFPTVRS